MPLLGDSAHTEMINTLQTLAHALPRPRAILVVSAHWEAKVPTLTASSQPPLIYDYHGFPPEAYTIEYACEGLPDLAAAVKQAMATEGIDAHLDRQRGLDHGVFVPLKILYPQADIPCVQLSLTQYLNPEEHLAMGRALRALNWDGLLVVGSGFTFHNMRAFFEPDNEDADYKNDAFDAWLRETLMAPSLGDEARLARLIHWMDAPFARFCHPREEHLMPLHVCYGLTQRPCDEWITANVLHKASGFALWRAQV